MRSVFNVTFIVFSFIFLTNHVWADVKTDIYSKLKDRRCTMPLDKCDCPDAKEMKAYIDALIETGVARDEIFYKVAKKFSLKTIIDEQVKRNVENRLIKEAGENRSQIIIEPATFNFGKISKKQNKISKTFKLYNKGNSDLIITNLRVSCGCVTISLAVGKTKSPYFGVTGSREGWQEIIKPGKVGELEVVLDLNHSSMTVGKQMREIFISSNDPLYPQINITVEVEVIE